MNVMVAKLKRKSGKRRPASVGKTTARSASARLMEIFTLDANSPTFNDDLAYVHGANVAKARRENVRLFGSADGLPVRARQPAKPKDGKRKRDKGDKCQ